MLVGASAQNFDNHHRALQRARDLAVPLPLSKKEELSLRSLIAKGRMNVIPQNLAELPEVVGNDVLRRAQRKLSKGPAKAPPKGRAIKPPPKHAVAQRAKPKPEPPVETRLGATSRGQPQVAIRSNEPYPEEVRGRHSYGKGSGKGGHYEDDDYYGHEDDDIMGDDATVGDDDSIFSGPNYVEMYLEGLQDGRLLQEAIVPNPGQPDDKDAGTLVLWNDEPIFALETDISGNSTSGVVADESNQIAFVTGRCTRTDPFDELDPSYIGRSYCQFVYELFDDVTGETYELTAEGPVTIGSDNVLAITGGTGIYTRAVGEIILSPVDPNVLPSVEPSFTEDLAASFVMQAFIYMDQNQLSFDLLDLLFGFLDAF